MRKGSVIALTLACLATPLYASNFTLTLLHHSDAESALIAAPNQPNFGGVARFKSKIDQLRATAANPVLTLSNGDMFLAGPQLDAVRSNPAAPFYDALAQDLIGYTAHAPANHEYDFGPAFARRYYDQFQGGDDFFLGANIDYSAEPALAPLVGNKLRRSLIVEPAAGVRVGIVGVLPSELKTISSPGNVSVTPSSQLVSVLQAEIDALRGSGVNKIILMGQQQTISNDVALIPQLRGVDVVISGGGGELVSDPGTALVPGDVRPATVAGLPNQYPLRVNDADGKSAVLVGGAGFYKYVGKLDITFDAAGDIVSADGNTLRIASTSVDAVNGVNADPVIQAQVVDPVQAHVAGLQAQRIARTTVPLEGRRNGGPGIGIRLSETNLGSLTADALVWQAAKAASESGSPLSGPIVGVQNGGGIRNDSLIPAASAEGENLSRFDAFSVNAFVNFVVVAEDVSASKIKQVLEHSVASVGGGQFGHWSGLNFSYYPNRPAGFRIDDVFLVGGGPGGTDLAIITDGVIDPNAPLIDLATIDFLANGGDAYPLRDLTFSLYPLTYTDALENFITAPATDLFGGLAGLNRLIDDTRYAAVPRDNLLSVDPGRRIDAIPEPGALSLLAPVGLLLARRRR
jgi:5'-nucleotidase